MINLKEMKPREQVFMLTSDVSGAYIIPCEVLFIQDGCVFVGTSTGAQVIIDEDNKQDFFFSKYDCTKELHARYGYQSYWN